MELATEKAAQSVAGNAGAGQAFLTAMRQGVKQQVVEGIIAGVVESDAVKAVLAPFLTTVQNATETIVMHPDQASSAVATIDAAWQQVLPALTNVVKFIEAIAPRITGLEFAEGGIVPGFPGTPAIITAHAGELVLNPRQQQAYAHARHESTVVNVNINGATLLSNSDLHEFADRVGEATLRQLKMNGPISHSRH